MKPTPTDDRPALPRHDRVVAVVGAAIFVSGRCLVARRTPGGSSGGRWEFPGGKVELGESPEQALCREIQEELGTFIRVEEWVGRGVSEPDDRFIVLDVYRCALVGPKIKMPGPAHDAILWATSGDLNSLNWALADVPIVPRVAALLSNSETVVSKDRGRD